MVWTENQEEDSAGGAGSVSRCSKEEDSEGEAAGWLVLSGLFPKGGGL